MKRTKRAKRMRTMLCYPNKKLYPDFQSFADDGWIPFNEEVQKYWLFLQSKCYVGLVLNRRPMGRYAFSENHL